MRWRWAAGVAVVALLVLGGAFAYMAGRAQSGYEGVDELVADLRRNGVKCTGLMVSPPDQSQATGAEFGFCFIGERNVNIHVYYDSDRVAGHVEGNVSVRGDNPNYFTSLVRGPNWVVDTYSEETSEVVQDAIGGTIE